MRIGRCKDKSNIKDPNSRTDKRKDRSGRGIPAFLSHARQPPRRAEPPLCRRGEPRRAKACKGKCRHGYGLRAAKHRRGAPRRRRAHTPVDARAGERARAGAAISSGQASARPTGEGWCATAEPPPPAPPRAAAARCSARKKRSRVSEGFGWRGDGAAMAPPPDPTVRRQESCRWRVGREKKGERNVTGRGPVAGPGRAPARATGATAAGLEWEGRRRNELGFGGGGRLGFD